ncbi:coilin-like isoform X2 [Bidens hawaiensis]|uniref:coilin-like isoform X2 n=1 Tax=Bidens hawaiensis TaxID=980011 RepID=UPI00404B392B
MGTTTPPLRIRLVFLDPSILTKPQRSDGMNNSWLLIRPQQHPTVSDVITHLIHVFKLRSRCPDGILLSMEGFTLPPFESTEILKDKDIICVKKKGGKTQVEDDKLEDNGLLLLENNKLDKDGEYSSESEEVDEELSQDEESPEEAFSKKRKALTILQNMKKKRRCVTMLDDDEDEAEADELENINNVTSHHIKAATSNKKVKSSTIVKRSEDLQENAEEVIPVAKKVPSRSSRRKTAKRKQMKEYAKIAKKKPKVYSKPEVTKHKNEEDNSQPKGLLYWKQNGDVDPVVTRPRHIRFEPLDEDQPAKHIGVSNKASKWSSSSSKRKGQKWGRENFFNQRKKEESKRINKEIFKTLFKDSQVPVIDINDFDKLPPCSEPKEGDVIAYRLLELNSSWIPEFSSFRVGRISYYDAKDIVLIPVAEYPIAPETIYDNGPNGSLYGEDGSLEINYSALVDVRNILQHDPDATKTVNNDSQTPLKDKNPVEGEVSPWDRFSSKITEIPDPNYSGLSPCSYGGPGPSTSTSPEAAESSGVKEGQKGNSADPWLAANTPDVKKTGPTENDCENGNSWGRPWSTFVVSRGSSVIQQDKQNEWRAGSSRGSGKPWSRGASRGRGRGRGRGRNGNLT